MKKMIIGTHCIDDKKGCYVPRIDVVNENGILTNVYIGLDAISMVQQLLASFQRCMDDNENYL